MAIWTIWANYDDEAKVWSTANGDIPGLLVDAPSIEELAHKAGAHLPDLLEVHGDDFEDKAVLQGPHSIRVIAFHEHDHQVAA
jgi:hypothetical protein